MQCFSYSQSCFSTFWVVKQKPRSILLCSLELKDVVAWCKWSEWWFSGCRCCCLIVSERACACNLPRCKPNLHEGKTINIFTQVSHGHKNMTRVCFASSWTKLKAWHAWVKMPYIILWVPISDSFIFCWCWHDMSQSFYNCNLASYSITVKLYPTWASVVKWRHVIPNV